MTYSPSYHFFINLLKQHKGKLSTGKQFSFNGTTYEIIHTVFSRPPKPRPLGYIWLNTKPTAERFRHVTHSWYIRYKDQFYFYDFSNRKLTNIPLSEACLAGLDKVLPARDYIKRTLSNGLTRSYIFYLNAYLVKQIATITGHIAYNQTYTLPRVEWCSVQIGQGIYGSVERIECTISPTKTKWVLPHSTYRAVKMLRSTNIATDESRNVQICRFFHGKPLPLLTNAIVMRHFKGISLTTFIGKEGYNLHIPLKAPNLQSIDTLMEAVYIHNTIILYNNVLYELDVEKKTLELLTAHQPEQIAALARLTAVMSNEAFLKLIPASQEMLHCLAIIKGDPRLTFNRMSPIKRLELLLMIALAYQNQILSAGIIHLDIKPDNIVVDTSTSPVRVHFVDVGLSLPFDKPLPCCRGSVIFMSPEMFELKDKTTTQVNALNHTVGVKSDIFTLGKIFLLVLGVLEKEFGTKNMDEVQEINKVISIFDKLPYVHSDPLLSCLKEPICELLSSMLQFNPSDRITIEGVIIKLESLIQQAITKRVDDFIAERSLSAEVRLYQEQAISAEVQEMILSNDKSICI